MTGLFSTCLPPATGDLREFFGQKSIGSFSTVTVPTLIRHAKLAECMNDIGQRSEYLPGVLKSQSR